MRTGWMIGVGVLGLGLGAGLAGAQTFDFGLFDGQWDNITFGSSGPASLLVEDMGADVVGMNLDLDGGVFGGGDPDPVQLTGTMAGDVFTLDALVGHPTYGDVSGGVDAGGALSFDLVGANDGAFALVTLRGSAVGNSIQFDYEIFTGADDVPFAVGEVNMRLVPAPGAVTLAGIGGLLFVRRWR